VNFKIPDVTDIRVTPDGGITRGTTEGINEEMWEYGGKTGIQALIELFNATEMPKPYMAVDDDGESVSCFNLSRINYATLSLIKDRKTGKTKEKIKLTGNSIKSKALPEYIEEFIDKGLELILHGKGKEFVDYYYNYVEDIRYMQIPLKKIASKSKVKLTLKGYRNRGTDKNGRQKAMQAHMELLIADRQKKAVELFEIHKHDIDYDGDESKLSPDDKMKLIINYMPPEPELDSTVYYVNTGYVKSHGDSKEIKDKDTGEMRMASTLISKEDLENDPDMKGEYNYEKYLAAFNERICYTQKKIGGLLSAFEPEVAKMIPATIIKKGENKGELKKEMFSSQQLKLKSFDLDTFEEAMHLEDKEVDFWNKTGYDPRLVWDGFKVREDHKIHYEIYDGALEYLNEKMRETGKPEIKSINSNYQSGDLILIKDDSRYHVGAFNGVFIQIVRSDVEIPKSETELELDRLRQEKQNKVESLKSGELTTKSAAEEFQEAQTKKRQRYFDDFKKEFGIADTVTLEMVYQNQEAFGALETFISTREKAIQEEANKYLDVDAG